MTIEQFAASFNHQAAMSAMMQIVEKSENLKGLTGLELTATMVRGRCFFCADSQNLMGLMSIPMFSKLQVEVRGEVTQALDGVWFQVGYRYAHHNGGENGSSIGEFVVDIDGNISQSKVFNKMEAK